MKQYRRHDRQLIKSRRERTYYAPDGTDYGVIAKNRSPRFEQKGPALSDLGLTRQQLSVLRVKKSRRYYNDPSRTLPGEEFLCGGRRLVRSGQQNGGVYVLAEGCGRERFKASDCRTVRKNRGLVYIS